MKRATHFILFFLFITQIITAQTVYEDFEGGALITWEALNGIAYDGVVDNPSKDAVNGSDFVGQFTNDGIGDFNFALGTLTAPADLSTNNLFTIKIWAPYAPSRLLFKMEGGGSAVEKFIDITEANAWVNYTVDFSGAAGLTTLDKFLVSFDPFVVPTAGTFYIDDIVAKEAIQVYETFETGNEMGWVGADGVLDAPIANPMPNKVNDSANCGKYTKSGAHSYSLLIAERTTPFDFSVLNQLKISVNATAATQFLFKLEGAGGPAVEKVVNIGLANQWQEYTIDLSEEASYTHLNKAIIFFDQGVETSMDDYYFDNIYAVSAGACTNVVKDVTIIDDYECNRHATYTNGWDSISVIANPAPNAVNGSSMVGKYVDPLMEEWAALVIDHQNPIDFSVNNQLNFKLWSPKVTRVLTKLEGGTSPAKEVWVDVTEAGQWIDYSVDFSSEELNNHKKIALFFNAGNLPEVGDEYFIDEIRFGEKTTSDLENFENGAALPWEPLDQLTAIHGVFAVVDNPLTTGINASSKVGEYKKGSSPFSTVAAVAPGFIDISVKAQYNLDILAPAGSTNVTMQLESVTDGNKEVTRDLKTPGEWEKVSFNFAEFNATSDWSAMKLIFNPNVAEQGATFYFDNLTQSEATVDPCENAVAILNIIDDFECQRNYDFSVGSDLLSVVNNPNTTGNASTKVGLYKEQANEPWGALCTEFPDGIDLEVFNQLELQVLSPIANSPLLLKLEGGTSPAKELWTEVPEAGKWNKISADFSAEAGNDYRKVCFFFNGGKDSGPDENYIIDNLKWAHAPYNSCIMNFDDAAFTSSVWNYFPADNSGGFELVDNPNKSGINLSDKVGKATEKATGEQPWQGMFTNLESYINFSSNTVLKMQVLSPKVGAVTMKVEFPLVEGFPGGSGDNTVTNTKANEWEELSFDFANSPTPIDPAGQYARLTLIWDIENLPTADVVYYFDNVKVDGGDCGEIVGTNDPTIEKLSISPNPVNDVLTIRNTSDLTKIEIYSMYGQRLGSTFNSNNSDISLNVSQLQNGAYILLGYNQIGQVVAQSKFVKL